MFRQGTARNEVHELTDVNAGEGTTVLEKLRAAFHDPAYTPPVIPTVATELLRLSQQPNVSFVEVRRVLERDPLIAAKVMKIAQSPVYARAGNIKTLEAALVRFGLRTLSCFVMEAAMHVKVFRAPGYEKTMDQLSRHSAATAHLARYLARKTAMVSEHAFLCGLLHDVGSVAALVTLAAMPTRNSPVPPLAQVWSAVTDVHELASEIVCVSWKLPEEVAPVVARHHNPVVAGRFDPVAGVVTIADFLATELGYGVQGDVLPIPPPALLDAVGLDNTNIERLVDECEGLIPTAT